MENKSIRLRTKPGSSQNIMVKIDQDFDFLEVLSLKISQEELYSSFCANYGVIIGRVIANKGFGLPNAKVSIFVPISSEDEKNTLLKELYPYKSILTKDSSGKRYNLLLSKSTCSLNSQAVGSFPTKNEVLDNDIEIEIFEKYYKYTTRTNTAGDYMIFGVPTGTHVVHMDIDLSDAGVASIRPYDLIADGYPKNLFQSATEFKVSNNLDSLPQIKSGNIGTDVIPFWGDEETCEVGITRIDFDTNFNITPNALFFGSIFSDEHKMSLNKYCNPKDRMGQLARLRTGSGSIKVIRVSKINNVDWVANGSPVVPTELEDFELFNPDVTSTSLIDDDGNFAVPVPMNIGHVITNEFGDLIPSGNPDVGIPTKGMYRFAMKFNEPPTHEKRRTANIIFPSLSSLHGGTRGITSNPHTPIDDAGGTEDQRFTTNIDNYKDIYLDFQTFEWKQIYTISQFIKKYKKGSNRFSFLGLKNVDSSDATGYNPMPYTTMVWKSNILYSLMSIILLIASAILQLFVFLVILQFGFAFQFGFRFSFVKIVLKFCIGIGIHIRPFGFIGDMFSNYNTNDNWDNGINCTTPGCEVGASDGGNNGFVLECSGDAVEGLYCINLTKPCGDLGGDCDMTNGCPGCCINIQNNFMAIKLGTTNNPSDINPGDDQGCLCANPNNTTPAPWESNINATCVYFIPSDNLPCCAFEAIKSWECCMRLNAAEKFEVMRRCFFDAWLTGSAYLFQFKYKGKIKSDGRKKEKFCGPGSDTTAGDNYKNQKCCPNGDDIYEDQSCTGNDIINDGTGNEGKCPRCLLRGPSTSQNHSYSGVKDYHYTNHNESISNTGYGNGATDLNDTIYCNAYYSTKIVNLGRIEMCEDVLFEIEKCVTTPSCEIDEYEQLPAIKPNVSSRGCTISSVDLNISNGLPTCPGVGTGYELSWDQNIWMNIMQETSYQDPVEVIFYLLKCWTSVDTWPFIEAGGCKCRPKKLFHKGSGCHENELLTTHEENSTIHPYDYIKELSKIYTEIVLNKDDLFVPGHELYPIEYEEYS